MRKYVEVLWLRMLVVKMSIVGIKESNPAGYKCRTETAKTGKRKIFCSQNIVCHQIFHLQTFVREMSSPSFTTAKCKKAFIVPLQLCVQV